MKVNSLLGVPVTGGSAASMGVGGSRATAMSVAGRTYAPALIPGSAVIAASRAAVFTTPRREPANKRPLGVKAELPLVDNRKQYVHMTRVNAGGDGASGPHPEREPA